MINQYYTRFKRNLAEQIMPVLRKKAVFPGKADYKVYNLLSGLSGLALLGRPIFISDISIDPAPEGRIAYYEYNAFYPAPAGKAVFDEFTLLSRSGGYPFRAFIPQDVILYFQILHLPDKVTVYNPAQK